MISPAFFIETLQQKGIDFFTGVPDSLLKNICAYIADHKDNKHNIIAANEGSAVGIAAGHYLATERIPAVYMQNSGQGNSINPLASLTDKEVYNIPILLLIGWRGKPGVHDEPQHVKQGKITIPLLQTLGIQHTVMSQEESELKVQIEDAVCFMQQTKEPFAFVVEKDTFANYTKQNDSLVNSPLSREAAVQAVAAALNPKDCIVSTTGMISRELFEYRAAQQQGHERDFLTVGSMGHASQIALGIALEKTDRKIWCLDGDGALLMHMGGIALIGNMKPQNYIHVIFNNGAHDSVGGQPTVALEMNIPELAKSVGYATAISVKTEEQLSAALNMVKTAPAPVLLEIKVKKGNRKDLGRPTTTPIQNKEAFMHFLK